MNKNREVVIVVNPGSTTTKFAVWNRDESLAESVVRHDPDKLSENIPDQFDYRRDLIEAELLPLLEDFKVVGSVGRGGLLKPIKGGSYLVNKQMLKDLKSGCCGFHASNLGAMLADHFARKFKVDAYIVDPVTVDEFTDVARVSGVPWILRKCRSHALNIKAVVRRAARRLKKTVSETRFVVAHLGGGISIAPVLGCRIIDVNDALLGMGPFSPERAGALPIGPLIERCFSGEVTREELIKELSRHSGLTAYCGTSDVREVVTRMKDGDADAEMALQAMVYQVAKETAGMAAVLQGRIDAVIITGGLAHSEELLGMLKPNIEFLGQIMVFPGEGELQALAEGAFRVIDSEEEAREYK